MLAAVKKAGVIHMICHNYRKRAGGDAGEADHRRGPARAAVSLSAAPTCRTGSPIPNVPLYWRLQQGEGRLGRARRHRLRTRSTSRAIWSGEITEVSAALETFVKERPLPDNPKKKGRVTVDDASASIVRFANGALGTIEASRFATGPQELQPVRDQRQQGLDRVQPRADERARCVLHRRREARAGLPQHHGHRTRAPVLQGLVARRDTSSATSTRSSTPCTTCSRRSRKTSCRRRTSRTA